MAALLIAGSLVGAGCPAGDGDGDGDGDSDVDTDVDSDGDTDVDSDGDTDGDEDGDAPTECTSASECDDGDACTEDLCGEEGVCENPLRDQDDDGYADSECGGDDCDDSADTVNPGATEVCNGVDDDCDDECDETFDCCQGETTDCVTTCGSAGVGTCSDSCEIVCEPPLENSCNGVDDDCDGATDEVDSVLVTTTGGDSVEPALVWNGTDFGLVWQDDRDGMDQVYFAQVPVEPAASYAATRITGLEADARRPALAWADTGYGVVWQDRRDAGTRDAVYFTTFDATATTIATPSDIAHPTSVGRLAVQGLVWTGTEYGVAWHARTGYSSGNTLEFVRVATDGSLVDSIQTVGSSEVSIWLDLAWSTAGFGVVWDEGGPWGYQIRFRHISPAGVLGTQDFVGDVENSRRPSVTWAGTEWAAAWYLDGSIHVGRVTSTGTEIGTEDLVTAGDYPELEWTGSDLAMAWVDEVSGQDEIFVARMTATDHVIRGQVRVTDTAGASGAPSIAWNGDSLGVAWQDDEMGDNQIHYARVICEP